MDEGERVAESAIRLPPAAGGICAESREIWHRHTPGEDCRNGARSIHRNSRRNAADRRAHRERAKSSVKRLPRCDSRTEETATYRRRDSSVLRESAEAD